MNQDAAAREPCKVPRYGGRLFWKYALATIGIVCVASFAVGLVAIWNSYEHQKQLLIDVQQEQAEAAAVKIGLFLKDIERQLGWTVQVPWAATTLAERRVDAIRLMRQVPAITELAILDDFGREQLKISRLAVDVIGSGLDRSTDPAFLGAQKDHVFYGPVYLHRDSEPHMTLALAGIRNDAGVSIANLNLKFIWDVVSQIKVGSAGLAYAVNAEGRLIAHPDISLVLRNSDFSRLPQVQALRGGVNAPAATSDARDIQDRPVLAVHATIAPLGWAVFVERPAAEAFAPAYASLLPIGAILAAAIGIAILASLAVARNIMTPIRLLQQGASRIGAGALDHRIDIHTRDELRVLGEHFNGMAARLQDSYATLERKVQQRTHELETANRAKSRFLAAASHDLRQPLHALGLFVAQSSRVTGESERRYVMGRIEAALGALNELFNALLDISKLDAGVLSPDVSEFPVQHLLGRLETTFAEQAQAKNLRLHIVPSSAWVRSDAILLERILLNLTANAVRYTRRGGVVIGCRRCGALLRIEIWDSGPGIPGDQRQNIFEEFYRLGDSAAEQGSGLGLGLAIVERLSKLLEHPLTLRSRLGQGSCFAVSVPKVAARAAVPATALAFADPLYGKFIVVIDDDELVLEAMQGILQTWGCRTVAAHSAESAMAMLRNADPPDLIMTDAELADRRTGLEAIESLRRKFGYPIPAFLISGDVSSDCLRAAANQGYQLLHKPVDPMTLRAIVTQLLKDREQPIHGNKSAIIVS